MAKSSYLVGFFAVVLGMAAADPVLVAAPPVPSFGSGRGNTHFTYAVLMKANKTSDQAQAVQPVWDQNCQKCHSGADPKGKLNLSGEMTELFNVSYESLITERRTEVGLLGLIVGENHPKTGNVEYLPARSLGSHTSVLVAMLSKVKLADPKQAERAAKLAEVRKNINLTPVELLKVTNWVDTNGQYYGTWWGRRNLKYKGMPDFRPLQTFDMATTNINPLSEPGGEIIRQDNQGA